MQVVFVFVKVDFTIYTLLTCTFDWYTINYTKANHNIYEKFSFNANLDFCKRCYFS